MDEPHCFEVKTHPADAAKKSAPYHTGKVIATEAIKEVAKYPGTRDDGGNGDESLKPQPISARRRI